MWTTNFLVLLDSLIVFMVGKQSQENVPELSGNAHTSVFGILSWLHECGVMQLPIFCDLQILKKMAQRIMTLSKRLARAG